MKTSSSINSCSSQAVHSSGTVTPLICSVIAVLSCTLDVTYFPFDKQTCQVTFASDIESDYILGEDGFKQILVLIPRNLHLKPQ